MTLHIFCFSPTGTTLKISREIASGMGMDFEVHDLTHDAEGDIVIPPGDFAIISAPVYGGKTAPIAKTRMGAIKGNNTPCAVVAVYGNRSFENAVEDLAGFAKSAGFRPIAAAAFIGEHSYSTPSTPIAQGRPDGEDLDYARSFGKSIADKISRDDFSEPDVAELKPEKDPETALKNFREFVMRSPDFTIAEILNGDSPRRLFTGRHAVTHSGKVRVAKIPHIVYPYLSAQLGSEERRILL